MLAADERRSGRGLRLTDAASRLERAPGVNRLRLSLRHDALVRLVRDRLLGRAHRRLVDDQGSDGRCRLQASSRVDDVAGDDPLPALGPCAERHDGLPRRDRGSDGELEPTLAQLLDRLEDSQGGADRALGVVLVRHRGAEHGHDGVADELLDRPAEALDVGLHALVVRAERRADVLGVGAVRSAREADEVDEEDRHDLALLAGRSLRSATSAARTRGRIARAPGSPHRTRGSATILGSSQRTATASTRRVGAARPRPRRAGAAGRSARARPAGAGARPRRERARRPRLRGSGRPPRAGRPARW